MPEVVDAISLNDRGLSGLSDEDFEKNAVLLQKFVLNWREYEYNVDGIKLFMQVRSEMGGA